MGYKFFTMRKHLHVTTFFALMIILILVFAVFLTPAFAQPPTEYQTLSPLPGTKIVKSDAPEVYFTNIFNIFVAVVAILSVIKLMICGFQYMMSEAVSSKENAKKCIWAVVGGIFLILLSFLILQTINPDLVRIHFDTLKLKIEPLAPGGVSEQLQGGSQPPGTSSPSVSTFNIGTGGPSNPNPGVGGP